MCEVKRGVLTAEQFNALAESVGWGHPTIKQIEIALKNSLYTACVVDGNKVIAMRRIVEINK